MSAGSPQTSLRSILAQHLLKGTQTPKNETIEEFSRRRLWIRPIEGDVVPFTFRRIQSTYMEIKRAARAAGKPRKFLLLKYRRGGFSTVEQAENYRLCVTQPRAWVATIAHTKETTHKLSLISKLFREMDPEMPKKPGDKRVTLDFPETKSRFVLGTAGGTAFGRGDTLQRVHCSEVAWWCPGPEQYQMVDRLVAGLQEATTGGEIVLESTPNGVEWFCSTFREARAGLNDWTPIFLPWFADHANSLHESEYSQEEILDTMTEEEKNLTRMHNLTAGQVAWRRAKIKANRRLFKQEYPEDPDTCFLTSGTPFFDLDLVMELLEGLPGVEMSLKTAGYLNETSVPGGKIVWAEPPKPGEDYVMGADASEGLPQSDPSCGGVLNKRTGEQVAWIYGRFRPEIFAKHLYEVGTTYNEALLGVERNNHGHSVLNTLSNVLRYPNLFYEKNERGVPGPGKSGKLGWGTDSSSRPIMLDDLEQALRDGGIVPRHRGFLGECMTFKLQQNGKFEADPGAHDDTVIAWAIAHQMRKHSRHRSKVIILG